MALSIEATRYMVVGVDQSINHAGMVCIDQDGRVVSARAFTDTARPAPTHEGVAILPSELRTKMTEDKAILRLAWVRRWITTALSQLVTPTPWGRFYCVAEDYAYGQAMRAHQIGEVGGQLRLALADLGCPVRFHDPASLKLFATGKGTAEKSDMLDVVRDRYGVDFLHLFGKRAVAEDLADAFLLAQLGRVELEVRAGRIQLEALKDHERQVFLRVTKKYPVNLLARPWAFAPIFAA